MGSINWLFVYLLTRFALPEYDFEKASPMLVGYLTQTGMNRMNCSLIDKSISTDGCLTVRKQFAQLHVIGP